MCNLKIFQIKMIHILTLVFLMETIKLSLTVAHIVNLFACGLADIV